MGILELGIRDGVNNNCNIPVSADNFYKVFFFLNIFFKNTYQNGCHDNFVTMYQ